MEVANRNECEENPTDRPANMHTTTYQFCIIYRKKKTKRTQKNCRKTGNHYVDIISNVRQRKERKQSTKTAKLHAEIKVTKKSSENNSTVFHRKNATGTKKTQGKHQT